MFVVIISSASSPWISNKYTRHWPDAGLMLDQRLRRWPSIKPSSGKHIVFTWCSQCCDTERGWAADRAGRYQTWIVSVCEPGRAGGGGACGTHPGVQAGRDLGGGGVLITRPRITGRGGRGGGAIPAQTRLMDSAALSAPHTLPWRGATRRGSVAGGGGGGVSHPVKPEIISRILLLKIASQKHIYIILLFKYVYYFALYCIIYNVLLSASRPILTNY